jgi:hypothetical protein
MITTKTFAIDGSNHVAVEYLVSTLAPGAAVRCHGERSADGVHWSDAPGLALRADAAGVHAARAEVERAGLRFVVEREGCGPAEFDLRVRLARLGRESA